jgi:hypothetical protein
MTSMVDLQHQTARSGAPRARSVEERELDWWAKQLGRSLRREPQVPVRAAEAPPVRVVEAVPRDRVEKAAVKAAVDAAIDAPVGVTIEAAVAGDPEPHDSRVRELLEALESRRRRVAEWAPQQAQLLVTPPRTPLPDAR